MQMSEQCEAAERRQAEAVAELQRERNSRRSLQHALSSLVEAAHSSLSSGMGTVSTGTLPAVSGDESGSSKLACIRVQLDAACGRRSSSGMMSLLLPPEADATLASAQARERRSLSCILSDLQEAAHAHAQALPALRAAHHRLNAQANTGEPGGRYEMHMALIGDFGTPCMCISTRPRHAFT